MSSPKERRKGSKTTWTPEEDAILREAVNKYGEGKWGTIQKNSGLNRSSDACRMYWKRLLKTGLIKGNFTQEEVDKILNLVPILGNKWDTIAKELPGRTGNDVKSFYIAHKKEKKRGERIQQLVVGTSHEKTSTFGHGSRPSHQFPDPDMDGKSSSKFPHGLGSSQFPHPDSMFAQGSRSSQFPAMSPSPVMQQQNSLDSTFSNTPAAGPALIDPYTGLSENTFLKAGQTSLTGGTETQQGSGGGGGGTLKRSFYSLDKPAETPSDNCHLESMLYPAKAPEGSSDDFFLPFNIDLANQLDLSISQEDFDMAMNPLNEIFEPFNKIQKKDK
ncbi:hypothetical protein RIF29_17765 [Crotalaria pallida]|uniref:Uncharacterized protein n=1 Tax=Crotalaria pallida TaxID=3830 RepID=A0AAN9IEU8_CROPI